MNKYYHLPLLVWLIFFVFPLRNLQAQTTPDHSLGAESSVITPFDPVNIIIDGGARRGTNLFHSFQQFNIGEGRGIYFSNPTGITNIFTRVTGGNKSNIFGTLGVLGTANLFLINPYGIFFGEKTRLDIHGSFLASTADGIKLGESGFFNAINPQASHLLSIQPSALFTHAIRNYQANLDNQANLTVNTGKSLILSGDTITHSGKLTAPGGTVFVLGKKINLIDKAEINVSSPTDAGKVFIGGGFQGGNNIPTAINTYVAPGVKIKADALNNGNGGTVIVWADKSNDFYGSISAQGGLNSGNGGLVEVSAKESLKFRGNVNTNAAQGLPGTLLLDPTNIIIANGDGAINDSEIEDGQILANNSNDNFTISEKKLEALSGDTNVILQATNDIILQDLNDNFLTFSAGEGKIELIADSDRNGIGNFTMQDLQDTIRTNGRNIEISAANLTLGTIDTRALAGSRTTTVNVNAGGEIVDAQGTLENPIATPTNFTFTVSNIENISDIDIIFSATHSYVSDLVVSLTSPQGTTVNLFNSIGNDGVNFQDTRLNEEAATSILNATAPFAGEFRPEGSLNNFKSENPNGTWTLTVTDQYPDFTGNLIKSGDSNVGWTNPIGTQLIFTSKSVGGDSGSIKLNATNGNINAISLDTSSSTGKTGNISLNATQKISIADQIKTFHTNGNGGEVTLTANGNISLNGLLNTSGGIFNNNLNNSFGDGGSVLIKSKKGSLNINEIDSHGINKGGNISLEAEDKIRLQNSIITNGINSISGDINITTKSDIILEPGIDIAAFSSNGLGGNVTLNSQGNISMTDGTISTFSGELAPVTTAGGNIDIIAKKFSANNVEINTFTNGSAKAGDIKITAEEISFDNSNVYSLVAKNGIGNGGNIELIANKVSFLNRSILNASSNESKGNAGDITIKASELLLTNESQISAFSTSTIGGNINIENLATLQINDSQITASTETGKAGSININANQSAAESLHISGQLGYLAAEAKTATGETGSLTINVNNVNIENQAIISVANISAQTGGDINLENIKNLQVNNGKISASTVDGQAGNININAKESVQISGDKGIVVEATGQGAAGNLTINTSQMNISDGAVVSAANANGEGGNVNITADNLTITNGGKILTTTSGSAKAGNISLTVLENLALIGENSGLFANTTPASSGDSGSIHIDSQTLNIRDGGGIGVNSEGSGKGGNIFLQAGTVLLDKNAFINAETASNQGGEINLQIENLLFLRQGSQITATAGTEGAGGDGGNININTPFIVAFPQENSDITANAFQGDGGKINITTNAIFGLAYQLKPTPNSDITASSQFGLAGEVQINTPEVDPTSGLVELASNIVDAESLVEKNICAEETILRGGSFVITGKGGLAADTNDLISNSPGIVEWANRQIKPEITPIVRNNPQTNQEQERIKTRVIQQAQGWIIAADGKVILTAEVPKVTLQNSGLTHPVCHPERR